MARETHIVETYLTDLESSLPVGVKETSQYTPFVNLFNAVGSTLKPKVVCHSHPRSQGAGIPDCGLFTTQQVKRQNVEAVAAAFGQGAMIPERGVIEIKPVDYDLRRLENSAQTQKYWLCYHAVLLSNYRAFSLIGTVEGNPNPVILEEFELAASEAEFRDLLAHPRAAADKHGPRFIEFIRRVMLHSVPLTSPQDVAALLASYARDALDHVETVDPASLEGVKEALGDALGLRFPKDEEDGGRGTHFFRSALVQTLFYGIFSAWVLWCKRQEAQASGDDGWSVREAAEAWGSSKAFDWRMAHDLLHLSVIGALFDQVNTKARQRELGLVRILNSAAATLNRVKRVEFFQAFAEGQAVQFFYEPFLAAFDPELRQQLGVWFTPPEIVEYMVRRVDMVLRTELGVADGLADPNVVVLDPCCGTGAYLVETVKVIAATLRAKGDDDLLGLALKRALVGGVDAAGKSVPPRLFGFEILPAPFVVAHLQLGLLLQQYGAHLADDGSDRCGVYLTNALTGWEPPVRAKQPLLDYPELQQERDAAEHVKQQAPILVIIGNPPYNAFAGVSPEEEEGLVAPYKAGLNVPVAAGGWGIRKFNLDDLYIRFFRLAERRIAESKEKRGIVCFISNFSYLTDPSFVVMRQRFLREFDLMWFDCLNGDSRETGKLTPDGKPDPSVFSTDYNRAGIRVGTAVGLLVKRGVGVEPVDHRQDASATSGKVRFRHFWGAAKRADLLTSLHVDDFDAEHEVATPTLANRYSFRPSGATTAYLGWRRVSELCAFPPYNGPIERRANSLIAFRAEEARLGYVAEYLDAGVPNHVMGAKVPAFMTSSGEFRAEATRAHLVGRVKFSKECIVAYPFKPFDVRCAYLDNDIAPLFSRPAPQLLAQRFSRNSFFITRDTADKYPEGPPFLLSRVVCDYDCISGHARHFPILLAAGVRGDVQDAASLPGMAVTQTVTANLSPASRAYLARLGFPDPDADQATAELLWMHALAIGYSPAYLDDNADGIRQDWPRIPIPGWTDLQSTVPEAMPAPCTSRQAGVRPPSADPTRALLEASAALGRQVAGLLDTETLVPGVTSGNLPPESAAVARVTHKDGKAFVPERDFVVTAGWGHGGKGGVTMPGRGRMTERGPDAFDIWLNDDVCWQNVPRAAWDYVIGGYQVLKKWLSYREHDLLGRALTEDEVREFRDNARRLTALAALHPALDDNYRRVATVGQTDARTGSSV